MPSILLIIYIFREGEVISGGIGRSFGQRGSYAENALVSIVGGKGGKGITWRWWLMSQGEK